MTFTRNCSVVVSRAARSSCLYGGISREVPPALRREELAARPQVAGQGGRNPMPQPRAWATERNGVDGRRRTCGGAARKRTHRASGQAQSRPIRGFRCLVRLFKQGLPTSWRNLPLPTFLISGEGGTVLRWYLIWRPQCSPPTAPRAWAVAAGAHSLGLRAAWFWGYPPFLSCCGRPRAVPHYVLPRALPAARSLCSSSARCLARVAALTWRNWRSGAG